MSVSQENLFHSSHLEVTSENHISRYYSVENEINFVSKQLEKGIYPKSAARYIDNSIHRFLGEFVGKVKIDKIDYEMKNGRIYFDGVASPISQTYKERGQIKGENSREYAESVGFEKIEKKFASDEANVAFWISPPSIDEEGFGNYGFLFVLVKDATDHIDEYILKYQGETAELKKSSQKYNELISLYPVIKFDKQPIDNPSVNGFLQDPLFAKTQDPEKFLSDIGYKDLSEYRKFHQELNQKILFRNWLDEYIETILQATQETEIFLKMDLINQAERYLAGIYNLAFDIKNNQLKIQVNETRQSDSDYRIMMAMRQNYIQKDAIVIGGGSCPADTTNIKSPFQNGWESIFKKDGILDYQSASKLSSEDKDNDSMNCVTCPFCKKIVDAIVTKDKITCPKCHESVDKK